MSVDFSLVVDEARIWECIRVADEAYGDNVRKVSGERYIVHPHLTAMHVLRFKGRSKQWLVLYYAALIHDVPEDTDFLLSKILEIYGPLVLSLVIELTNDEEAIKKYGKLEHHKKKVRGISSWALVIKLCDMLANLMSTPSAKQVEVITLLHAYLLGTEETGPVRYLSKTHRAILAEIGEVLGKLPAVAKPLEVSAG